MASDITLGIDFGGYQCRVVSLSNREQQISNIPTALAVCGNDIVYGEQALQAFEISPRSCVYGFKSLTGKQYDASSPQYYDRWPFSIKSSSDGDCVVELLNTQYKPQQLFANLLNKLIDRHVRRFSLTKKPSKCVLTVPTSFTETQRGCMKQAAELAGLEVLGVIYDCVAAAFAYSTYGFQNTHNTNPNKVLILDLGATKLELSAVSFLQDRYAVESEETNEVSGEVFDKAIHNWFSERAKSQGIPSRIVEHVQFKNKLLTRTKSIKESLSLPESSVTVSFTGRISNHNYEFKQELSHSQFQHVVQSVYDKCQEFLQTALRKYKSSYKVLLMVGLGSNIPNVNQLVQRACTGSVSHVSNVSLEYFTAKGAASFATFAHAQNSFLATETVTSNEIESRQIRTLINNLLQLRDNLKNRLSSSHFKLTKNQRSTYEKIVLMINQELGLRPSVNSLRNVFNDATEMQRQCVIHQVSTVSDRNPSPTPMESVTSSQDLSQPLLDRSVIPTTPNQVVENQAFPQSITPRGVLPNFPLEYRTMPRGTPSSQPKKENVHVSDSKWQDSSKSPAVVTKNPKYLPKCKGCCFYVFLIALLVLVFFFLPYTSSIVFEHALLCPPTTILDTDFLSIGPSIPQFNLHQGALGFHMELQVWFNFEFPFPPAVFVALHDIDSSQILTVDVFASRITSHSFLLTIRTRIPGAYPRESFLNRLSITWIAVGASCSDDSKAYLSSQYSFVEHELQWLSQTPFPYPADGSLLLLSAPQGFFFDELDTLSYHQEVVLDDGTDFLHIFSSVETSGRASEFRHNSLVLNVTNVFYNTIDVGTFFVNGSELNDDSPTDYVIKNILFTDEFIRFPTVYVYLDGFDATNSSISYICDISNVSFTGFSVGISFQKSSMVNLSFRYFALDEHSEALDLIDVALVSGFLCLVITAVLSEMYKSNLQVSVNADEEMFHVLEDTHVRPDYVPDDPERPENTDVPVDDKWLELLQEFRNIRGFGSVKRDSMGVCFWMFLSIVLLILLLVFYRDYILATKFFHQVSSVYITLFILGLEHFLIVLAFFTVSWPVHRNVKDYNIKAPNVAILIACHMSGGFSPELARDKIKSNFFKKSDKQIEDLQKMFKPNSSALCD
ncbi:hypothetical protein GEMRC1_001238 [Eukaryota sp. GEM-RC1]